MNFLVILLIIITLFAAVFFTIQRNNNEVVLSEEDGSYGKIITAIKNINNRLEILEKKYILDKEQSERSRKTIYENLGMQMEARKLDNIAVTGLLAREV